MAPSASTDMGAEVLVASHSVCEPWIPTWEKVGHCSAEATALGLPGRESTKRVLVLPPPSTHCVTSSHLCPLSEQLQSDCYMRRLSEVTSGLLAQDG